MQSKGVWRALQASVLIEHPTPQQPDLNLDPPSTPHLNAASEQLLQLRVKRKTFETHVTFDEGNGSCLKFLLSPTEDTDRKSFFIL